MAGLESRLTKVKTLDSALTMLEGAEGRVDNRVYLDLFRRIASNLGLDAEVTPTSIRIPMPDGKNVFALTEMHRGEVHAGEIRRKLVELKRMTGK